MDARAATSPRIYGESIPFQDNYSARARVEFMVPRAGAWEYRVDFYPEQRHPMDAFDALTGLWISIRMVSQDGEVLDPVIMPVVSVPRELIRRVQALA